MKILISGSSGFIGTALIESLSQKGHDVVRLTRGASNQEDLTRNTEGNAEGNTEGLTSNLIWNPPEKNVDLKNEQFDVIINLSGESVAGKKWTPEQKQILYQSRITTTRLLTSAIASMKTPPKLFLSTSAIGIYGERGNEVLTEKNILEKAGSKRTGDFMADLCKDWEETAQLATEAGVPTFALRIGLVVGEGAKFLKLQRPFFKLGLGGWLGKPKSWISWVSLDDTLGAINFILENSTKILTQNLAKDPDTAEKDTAEKNTEGNTAKNTAGDMFRAINVTAPNPATAKGFAKAFGKSLKRPVLFRIPRLVPRILMGKELVNALLQSAQVVPKELLDAGYEFKHPTIGQAFEDIS